MFYISCIVFIFYVSFLFPVYRFYLQFNVFIPRVMFLFLV
jgi:hypothetical protein